MKKCTGCMEFKNFSDFGKEPRVRDGLQSRCRACKAQSSKNWSSKNRQKKNDSLKNWREKNPEKVLTYNDRYRESKRETNKVWHLKNKDKNAAYLRARRARVRGSEFELFTETDLINKYGSFCHICYNEIDLNAPRRIGAFGWQMGLHVEHLIPVSKGGGTTLENTRPSHGICNLRKGASEIDYISR